MLTPTALPPSILDDNSYGFGEYLIKKYLVKEKFFKHQQMNKINREIRVLSCFQR